MKAAICCICDEPFLARTDKTARCPKSECRRAYRTMKVREWNTAKKNRDRQYAAKKADPKKWARLLARKVQRSRELKMVDSAGVAAAERERNRKRYLSRKRRLLEDLAFATKEAARLARKAANQNRRKRARRAMAEIVAVKTELEKRTES